ncbi:unnamed protein product [Adineta steineri]|uniref:Uncharacterized protein n=1 Tax=Adineta steineri TaxID=433720 RepID=A0A815HML4_9BILA|nr:unnamed protein product [Adineta steineri]
MFIKWFLVVLVPITRYLLGSTGTVLVGAFLMIVTTVIGEMNNLKTIFILCGMMVISSYFERECLIDYLFNKRFPSRLKFHWWLLRLRSTLTIFGNPQMALIVSKSNVFVDTHSRFEFKTCVEYLWIPTFTVWLFNSMSKKKSNMTRRYFSNICSNVLLTLLVLEQVPPTGSLQHKFDFWTYVKFDFLTTILLSLVGTLIIYRLLRVIH